jgi:nucleotide-binding universal stress UspA family protein
MRIVCATDFSEAARAALELAAGLALKLGDRIDLVHVLELPPLFGEDLPAGEAGLEGAMREAAMRELERARTALRARGITAEASLRVGSAAEHIRAAADGEDVRLVVIGTHGRKGAAHFFLGSVAEDVVRGSACPVLVTRGFTYPEDGLAAGRRLHLMVAVDGSPAAEAALGWAKTIRSSVPCDLTLVQPCWPPAEAERFGLPTAWAGRQAHPSLSPLMDRELRRWAGLVPGEGEIRCRFPVSHGRLADDIAAEAELLLPDFVLVGVSRRRFGASATMSPTATLSTIKIPVVCVPESLRPPAEGGIPIVATVLVGTDLTDFANQAIPAAYSLLRGGGGTVEICFVYERGAGSETAMDLPAERPPGPSLKDEVERKLRQLVPLEAPAFGIETAVTVVEASSVEEGLLHEAERIGADILVIASHGRTGIKRTIFGSAAEKIVAHGSRPVLVLYPRPR